MLSMVCWNNPFKGKIQHYQIHELLSKKSIICHEKLFRLECFHFRENRNCYGLDTMFGKPEL